MIIVQSVATALRFGHDRPAAAGDFFIGCTSADRDPADWIARELEVAGYTTLIQAWDIRPGMNFLREMQKGAEERRNLFAR